MKRTTKQYIEAINAPDTLVTTETEMNQWQWETGIAARLDELNGVMQAYLQGISPLDYMQLRIDEFRTELFPPERVRRPRQNAYCKRRSVSAL
jgi:hypothetical protein